MQFCFSCFPRKEVTTKPTTLAQYKIITYKKWYRNVTIVMKEWFYRFFFHPLVSLHSHFRVYCYLLNLHFCIIHYIVLCLIHTIKINKGKSNFIMTKKKVTSEQSLLLLYSAHFFPLLFSLSSILFKYMFFFLVVREMKKKSPWSHTFKLGVVSRHT